MHLHCYMQHAIYLSVILTIYAHFLVTQLQTQNETKQIS